MDETAGPRASKRSTMCACANIRKLLGAHLDGELGCADDEVVAEHLGHCPACRDELLAMQELGSLLSHAGPTPLPEALEQRVVALAANRLVCPRRRLARRARRLLPRVAAVVIGAATVAGFLSREEVRLARPAAGPRGTANALFGTLEHRPVAVDPAREFDDELRKLQSRPEARIVRSILSEARQ